MTDSNYDPALSIYRQAFEQVKPQIEAADEENFVAISIDIASAAVTAQGAYPEIVALRPSLVQRLPAFDISLVDKLEIYALAMFCTHADYRAAIDPPAALDEVVGTAIGVRAILLADINALIAHGLLAPDVTSGLLGTKGYKNIMTDLATLASILRTNAAKVAERTSVRPNELAEAEDLAAKLGKSVGLREQSPQVIARVTRNRQAAFTLFIKAYEEVRAAVQYLRHREGDADVIMPSLYAGRGGRKKAVEVTPDKPNTPPTPVVNPPTPAPSGNNGAPVAKVNLGENGPFMQ